MLTRKLQLIAQVYFPKNMLNLNLLFQPDSMNGHKVCVLYYHCFTDFIRKVCDIMNSHLIVPRKRVHQN